jgi:hypothetical protein
VDKEAMWFDMKKLIRRLIVVFVLMPPMLVANDQPVSEETLAALGLPEAMPNLLLSSMSQGFDYVEYIDAREDARGKTESVQGFVLFSDQAQEDLQFHARYDPELFQDEDRLVNDIGRFVRTQYRIRKYGSTYDPETVVVDRVSDSVTIVSLQFSKYALPQDVAFFRHMDASFRIENRVLKSAVVTNNKHFQYQGKRIDSYRQEIQFVQLDTGDYAIDEKRVVYEGEWKSKPYRLEVNGRFVAFYGADGREFVMRPELLEQAMSDNLKEIGLKIRKGLPFMSEMVRKQGIDLPLPYGISANYRAQELDLGFTYFSIADIPPEDLEEFFNPDESSASIDVSSGSIRGDVYILPFWNVYGVLGKNKTDITVLAKFNGVEYCVGVTLPDGRCLGQSIEIPEGVLPVNLNFDYETYGLGTTLALGYRNFFGSLNFTYTRSFRVGGSGDGTELFVFSPVVGYQFTDWRAQLLIGFEYQDYSANFSGTEFGNLNYDVGVKVNKWSSGLGLRKEFGQHWNVLGLYAKGGSRESITLAVGYRF